MIWPIFHHSGWEHINHVHEYKNGHVIIDTEGNPTDDDFRDLATNCDLLVIRPKAWQRTPSSCATCS